MNRRVKLRNKLIARSKAFFTNNIKAILFATIGTLFLIFWWFATMRAQRNAELESHFQNKSLELHETAAPYKPPEMGAIELVISERGYPNESPQYTLNGFHTSTFFSGIGSIIKSLTGRKADDWIPINSYCNMRRACKVAPSLHELRVGELGCADIQVLVDEIQACRKKSADSVCTSKLLDAGFWREVYKAKLDDGRDVVLKMVKMKHTDNVRNLLRHFRESILLQNLAGNPYVVNELGHCILGGNEYVIVAPFYEHNLEDVILSRSILHHSLDRLLRWTWEVAKGVEAMHGISGGPFVHADIQPRQFMIDNEDHVRTNDFNRGKFLPRDGDVPCHFCGAKSKGRWRAPEEYTREPLNEKLDIFSMGMVFWSMFAGEKVMEEIPKREVYDLIPGGYRPTMPKHMPQEFQEIVFACWQEEPSLRPSATEVARRIMRLRASLPGEDLATSIRNLSYPPLKTKASNNII